MSDLVQCLILLKLEAGSTSEGYTLVSALLRQIASNNLFDLLSSSAPYATLEKVNPPQNSKFDMIEMWQDLASFTEQHLSQEWQVVVHEDNYNLVRHLFPKEPKVSFYTRSLITERCIGHQKYTALDEDNLKIFEKLLKSGADIRWRRPGGGTLAHFAAEKGSSLLMALLAQCGADLNGGKSKGPTPLCIAVEKKDLELVKVLLANGADMNTGTIDGSTALHLAMKAGLFEVVQLLVEKGAHVNVKTAKGWTPLHLAANTGNLEVAALLSKHGADLELKIDTGTDQGATALHLAIKKERWAVAKWLVANGASVSSECQKGCNALYFAVAKNNTSFVEYLISRRCPDLTSPGNRKAFHSASEKKHSSIVKSMIELGFPLNADDVAKPNVLFEAIHKNMFEFVEKLLKNGADVNQKFLFMTRKMRPIHVACEKTDEKMVQLLLDYGADPGAFRGAGRLKTPIADAVESGKIGIVKWLLAKNVSVCDRLDLLLSATKNQHHELMELLLDNGAGVNGRGNYKDNKNKTCLYFAISNGDQKAVEILMKYGATFDFKEISIGTRRFYYTGPTPKFLETFLAHSFTTDLDATDAVFLNELLTECGVEYHIESSDSYPDIKKKCARTIAEHIVKMEAAGMTVGGAHNVVPAPFYVAYNLNEVQWEYEDELKVMEARTVCHTEITFRDLLTKTPNQIARYTRNESIRNELQKCEFQTEFPHYGSILECQFQRGEWHRELLAEGMKQLGLMNWRFRALPFELKEDIVGFLSNQDLLILQKCLPVEE